MSLLQVEKVHSTLEITLNNPKHANSFTLQAYKDLWSQVEKAESDSSISIILIKAEGKHFTSGNDLNNFSHFANATLDEQKQYAKEMSELVKGFAESFIKCSKVLIACCHGGVIGFFFPLLSIFDQVYITDDTYFFAPMILFGQAVEMYSTYTFPRLFGHGKAFSLLVKCEKLNASEAIQFGFAQKCFKSKEELHKYGRQACRELEGLKISSVLQAKANLINPIRRVLTINLASNYMMQSETKLRTLRQSGATRSFRATSQVTCLSYGPNCELDQNHVVDLLNHYLSQSVSKISSSSMSNAEESP